MFPLDHCNASSYRRPFVNVHIRFYCATLDKTYRHLSICLCESSKDLDNGRFTKVAKALADLRRFEIFQKIATAGAEGMRCRAVCEQLPVSQATANG